jgi:hypothetical protein
MGKNTEINATDERLQEMKNLKIGHDKAIKEIDTKTAALKKAAADFEAYKKAETTRIEDARKILARESANHAKLDKTVMQKKIDDLNSQIAGLTKENEDLKEQLTAKD